MFFEVNFSAFAVEKEKLCLLTAEVKTMGHPKKNLHTPEPKFPLLKLTSTQEHQLQGPSKIGDDHLSEIEISIPLSVYFVCDGLSF